MKNGGEGVGVSYGGKEVNGLVSNNKKSYSSQNVIH